MTTTSIQNSFNSGEISPKLWGRTDLAKLRNGGTTVRNFYIDYRGGAASRAGLAYVGMCKQGAPNLGGVGSINTPPRDINFQFNIYQGFVLEFGEFYMRIKSQGAYVTETSKSISNIEQASPAILTIIGHNYKVGDWIFLGGIAGMVNLNRLTWVVSQVIDVNTIAITDLFGVNVNSTLFPAYISGGTSSRIYTVAAPYAAADLIYLKVTQSANVMSLCCVNQQTLVEYPTYDLQRFGNTNWQFGEVTFSASIGPPNLIQIVPHHSTTQDTFYAYCVTSVDDTSGEESVAGPVGQGENNNISINAGSNTILWNGVPGASRYNIYKATPSYQQAVPTGVPFGYVGSAVGGSFIDDNVTADFTRTPPLHFDPFATNYIASVQVTNGGNGAYTQDTIGYAINTSTGSGAIIQLSVANGFLATATAINGGEGYLIGDTITITTGGAGPPAAASGFYTFLLNLNPAAGTYITLNGVPWYFLNPGQISPSGFGTVLGGNLSLTLAQLISDLNSTMLTNINVAAYSGAGTVVSIVYRTTGLAGNTYTLAPGTYGGVVSGATLTGGSDGGPGGGAGAAAVLTLGTSEGNSPSTLCYYQDRRGYANTLEEPDTYFFSKTGAFENMDSSVPAVDDDAVIGTPWAQQINGIQWMVPMQVGLIMMTGNSIWLLNGGNNSALTPADQTVVTQVYNGCSATVPPLVVDNSILYVQSKDSIVRDLLYNFIQGNYSGTDRTVLSSQLFDNHSIIQWAYAQEPNKIAWGIRDDGIVLSFTILREQDVFAWARHDTNGFFQGVCSITERHMADSHNPDQVGPLSDAVYFITKRYVRGNWVYYSERMDDRIWPTAEDCWCVDAGLANAQTFPNAILTPSAISGTGVTFTASASVFTPANVGDVIRVGGGIATVTSYLSGTLLAGTVTQTITDTVPDNPSLMPTPQSAGQWSITTPITVVTGLNHLEGLIVTGLADGNVIKPATVVNGAITLPYPASFITVGLPFLPQMQSVYLDPPSQSGTTQTKRKTINSVSVRMTDTRGISIGTNQPDASTQQNNATVPWSELVEIKQAAPAAAPGNAIPLFTGDYFMNVGSGWNQHGQVAIQQNYPLPANIDALIIYYNLGDT